MKILLFFLVGLFGVRTSAFPGPWNTSPQPDLAQQIEMAPELEVENVSQPTRTIRNEAPRFIPNATGSPDIVVVYYKGYQGPATVFSIDTNDGAITRSHVPRGRNCHVQGSTIAENGRLYTTLQLVGGGLELWLYDPACNRFEARQVIGKELDLAGQGNELVVGTDGLLYGTVGSRKTGQAAFFRIDPETERITLLGTAVSLQGSPYVGSLLQAADGKLYATYGKAPYRLIEFDPATSQGREVATANALGGIRIRRGGEGQLVFSITRIESGVETDGLYEIVDSGRSLNRIEEATDAAPSVDAINPKKKGGEKTSFNMNEHSNGGDARNRKAQYLALIREGLTPEEAKARALGGTVSASVPFPAKKLGTGAGSVRKDHGVEVDTARIDPTLNSDGRGRLRYRLAGNEAWEVAVLDPPLYAEAIVQLTTLPDGRVFGTATNRAGHFIHDPVTEQTTFLGRTGLQHHCSAISGNRVYLSGYPSSQVWSYDFSGPGWTDPRPAKLGQGEFGTTPPSDNPRQLGALREFSGVHIATCATVDSVGRVYLAGRWYRDGKGGGIGWWDPKTAQAGGFWENLSTLQVSDCCTTGGGRFVVMSTILVRDQVLGRQTPESASLCVIDTATNPDTIAGQIVPVPANVSTGLIAPAGANRLIGLAPSPDDPSNWILYGVDVVTGEVAFRKEFPGIPVTKLGPAEILHSYRNGMIVAPDGGIWLLHLGVLLRIDPETAHVRVVGRPVLGPDAMAGLDALSPNDRKLLADLKMIKADGAPATIGRFTFSGEDIYLAGTPWLRRIQGVAAKGSE